MTKPTISPAAISLTGLAVEYCKYLESCAEEEAADFCQQMLRYLPRIYMTAFDLKPYGESTEGADNGAIIDELDEEQYENIRTQAAGVLGEFDTYLDTMVDDMRFSDTPVAVSLAEQLADIYQTAYDFAQSMREAPTEAVPEVLADFKYRFDSYMSQPICSAMRATDFIYHNELK